MAWLGAASAAGIAAVEIVAVTRASQPLVAPDTAATLTALSAATLVSAVCLTGAYAARRREPRGWAWIERVVAIGSVLAVAASAVTAAVAIAAGPPSAAVAEPLDPGLAPIRLAARVSLGLIAGGILVGMARDFAGPVGRALDRRRDIGGAASTTRPGFLSLLGDELLVGRSGERRRAAESERARLAADLHALVLPELRRAAAAASSPDTPDAVAAGVRRSLEGVEQLMHERQSIVLEEFGLVAALEWLAERTQERDPLRVELELDGDRVDDRAALPADVARVAFRVALLALDNVVRHAGAKLATIRVSISRGTLRMSITDDGRGTDAVDARGGRGLVDMRTDAAAVGARLSVERLGDGTRIELAWSATHDAGSPAADQEDVTARSDPAAR